MKGIKLLTKIIFVLVIGLATVVPSQAKAYYRRHLYRPGYSQWAWRHEGHWIYGSHGPRLGWWWVWHGGWYYYASRIDPFPPPERAVVYIETEPAVIVLPQSSVTGGSLVQASHPVGTSGDVGTKNTSVSSNTAPDVSSAIADAYTYYCEKTKTYKSASNLTCPEPWLATPVK